MPVASRSPRGPGAGCEPDGVLSRDDRLGVAAEAFEGETLQPVSPFAVGVAGHGLSRGFQRPLRLVACQACDGYHTPGPGVGAVSRGWHRRGI